ncbi:MAG: DUF3316 domain-containing protein [Psychromonas sp.]|nr:DUF3316 domain-containing protein [Psychromonas sp.]
MKVIRNLLLASSILILSANVFARSVVYGNYSLHNDRGTIWLPAAESRETAYALGLEKLKQLKSEPGAKLADEFSIFLKSPKERNSVELDEDAYVTVEESTDRHGNIVYKAKLHLSYSYYKAN